MSAAAYHPIGGLEDLECGLKTLCKCELMAVPEFKSMYDAIEHHHRDTKLAHLTGKPKDLQDKAIRDTKFYNILVKMLCEVLERRKGEQRLCLKQVHTWYMTNKHVLFDGPRFGKHYLIEEAKELLRRTTELKQSAPANESRAAAGDQLEYDTPNRQRDTRPHAYQTEEGTSSQRFSPFPLDFDEVSEPPGRAATNSPELDTDVEAFGQSYQGADRGDFEYGDHHDGPFDNSALGTPRMFLRPKTAVPVVSSPLKEFSSNQPMSAGSTRKMVHPISSLTNPHATLAKLASKREAVEQKKKSGAPVRSASVRPSRSESLQAWQAFNKKRSYGQDVIGKLNLVGRSGTALGIRYSAHGHGEAPEAETHDFLKSSSKHRTQTARDSNKENMFAQQSLEEFYEAAESMMTVSQNSSTMPSYTRETSAASLSSQRQSDTGTSIQVSAHDRSQGTEDEQNGTGVKLDTVINVIDSVSDSMLYFKEKVSPEPQLGFRQPSATGLPFPRETSFSYKVPRDSFLPDVAGNQPSKNEEFTFATSPLPSSAGIMGEYMPDGLKKAKLRSSSACIIDWRGRIQPETIRYKWATTKCGGHTYVKKWYRPNVRSVGSTTGRVRPKTAPVTAKEKWKTDEASDKNVRVSQAVSHTTTIVNQDDVDSMVLVKQLLTAEDRTDSMDSLLEPENKMQKRPRKFPPAPTESRSAEFVSFVAPSSRASADKQLDSNTDPDNDEGRRDPELVSFSENSGHDKTQDAGIKVPYSVYDEDALNAAVKETLVDVTEPVNLTAQQPYSIHHSQPGQMWRETSSYPTTSRVERSAGRMPVRTSKSSAKMQASLHRHNIRMRQAPPSIPTTRVNTSMPRTGSGQILQKQEHLARQMKSQSNYLRNTTMEDNSGLGRSLQICKLAVPSREHTLPAFVQRHRSEQFTGDSEELRTASAIGDLTNPDQPGQNSNLARSLRLEGNRRANKGDLAIDKIGRPIAQVSQISSPEKLLSSVRIQKEAAAAVDIQRIFRGFVARNVYKKLLSEEISRREATRKAAVKIQRIYRVHLARKYAIYNRPFLNPELLQWSKDVKEVQLENAINRQAKLASRANEISTNHRQAKATLSIIGPHVQVYAAFHPKKTGPTRKELNQAAVKIQKIVKGWLVRRKMEKISQKAVLFGSSFYKLAKEYKTMLLKVQRQHGMDKAKSPFNAKDFSDYIDLRKRYETIFQKKSCGGELELAALESFFRECDLYPSQAEIDEAVDITLHGQAKRLGTSGLKKRELLDLIFYIYVPSAAGLEATRRSTWMNPIIGGQEARKLLGSEFVEPAPLAPCIKLVMKAKREQNLREQAQREADERHRIEESKKRIEESKQQNVKKS